VPVKFLSDEQAAEFASFQGPPTRAQLEKYFFLDDADREAIDAKRRDHNRLGLAVQLGVVRFLRRFLPAPRQVPAEVVDYLAQQLGITDPSCLKLYGQRDGTARTHAGEIEKAGGWIDFAEVEPEVARWISARGSPRARVPRRCSTRRWPSCAPARCDAGGASAGAAGGPGAGKGHQAAVGQPA
jgi:hypothetical protein